MSGVQITNAIRSVFLVHEWQQAKRSIMISVNFYVICILDILNVEENKVTYDAFILCDTSSVGDLFVLIITYCHKCTLST